MDKIRRDKRKEVHTRLEFGDNTKRSRRIREGSQNSSAGTLSARYRNPSERPKVRDRLKGNDGNVFGRLGHQRQSAFDRLSDTYSPSTTKSGPDRASSRDHSHSRGRPHRQDSSLSRDHPRSRDRSRGIEESYGNTCSSYRTEARHGYHSRDMDRPRIMKRGRESESLLSRVSESGTSDGGHWKSKSKRHKPTDEDNLAVPWSCEEVDPFTPRIRNFKSSRKTRMPNNVKTYDRTGDLEDHRDGETIEDFIKRFKVETGCMKRSPECMRISGFMHGVNNPELTKRLNEHVPKTMEEMMTVTTAFIRGETVAASKKKGHAPWKPQDQPKRHVFERKSDFRGKFKPPPPMVTPVEKRSSNKFCDFHNDKGHNTDECMQLKKQIEELVRAGKLSHLIKEIKQGRDQTKVGKKEAPAKDKSLAIYMVQPWHRMTRQKVTQSFARVSEITFPPLTTTKGTEGPLVIEAEIGGHMIHRMYVDGGSSTEVLYEHCFNRLRPEIKNQMVPATTSLTGFSGETIWPLGQLRLLVTIGDAYHSTKAWMNFMIVRSLSPYNGIVGRPGIREIQAVPSAAHGMLKFPVDRGIVTIRNGNWGDAIRERTDGTMLTPEEKLGYIRMAAGRHDRSTAISEHRLNIREGYSPVRQKKRGQAPKRAKAIQAEVQKLVEAGIMREVYYHDCVSSPVMVKKHDGSWRMCVDFTDLNKECPQDCYPLLEIDWKVESLCGYPFMCFLDAYKGYHQIQMAESDEEKTAFHTNQGVYCYTKMPFGLKNAGATYQRLVDKAFDSQVGRNIEVYVDDLVIKSHTEAEMLRDIDETFRTLRKINMKLNPKKCTFGTVEGMFLGYMISPEGITPCPDKTKDVLQLPSPRTIKEVQSLNGKLASLNRFLSKSAEKSLPLFKTLKKCIKKSDFHWTPEAEQAFKQLKQHLSELPLLVAPKPKEELIVYIKASPSIGFRSQAVMKILPSTPYRSYHRPTHQTNNILHDPTHQLNISAPLLPGVTKWRVMLGVHISRYRQGHSVKGTDLADFPCREASQQHQRYVSDRNPTSVVVIIHGQIIMCRWIRCWPYTDLCRWERRVHVALRWGFSNVHVSVDSKLVANQFLGTYDAKEENMVKYLEKAKSLISGFANFSISQVPRGKNKKADALRKITSTSFAHLSKQVLVEVLKEKSIQEEEVATVEEEEGPNMDDPDNGLFERWDPSR
ncbi:reverse transcriptase domain-containing protein [Tanacetum coccineum]